MRNQTIAKLINKLYRVYWFITHPKTKGVKALIFNQDKILMVRLTYYPNTWTFPGGGVNKKENTIDAIIRECKEEVGITLKHPEYIGDLHFEHEYKKDTVSVFKETIDGPEIKIDGKEVAEANWYELDKLPVMGKNARTILNIVLNK